MQNETHMMSGGCQCGAVRFRCEPDVATAHICHCRMCQKAVGNFYAALVKVFDGRLVWTKDEPSEFQSSSAASRGFCARCGTPLTYRAPDGMFLLIGAFDDPSKLPPRRQYGIEARCEFVQTLSSLPASRTSDDFDDQPFLADLVSHQHPDHPGEDERSDDEGFR
ncbi:GFA family protein [Fulvimarina endophytica]|uniref:GFA family protein n=1 Tax=Fulvimarina endophytica TaxID=2293836 RepID=A0A371XAF7_9HYPH|nr:GFA family protein [Fulvimarina endophytica]RFC66217.1 GFA family protein [Fulvimarina endophytica]